MARFERPLVVVPNGIDLKSVTPHDAPTNDRPRLVFTYSSRGPWPGVDLVLDAARRLDEFDFDIVGPAPRVEAPPANVRLHGVLMGAEYERVIARADVGIGSLGLHRIGLAEGSTLKVRGYLAAGLPTILGYRDTDFPGGAPFLLQLPAGEDSLRDALDDMRAFVWAQRGQRVPRDAIAHIDASVKEATRLSFMEQVAGAP